MRVEIASYHYWSTGEISPYILGESEALELCAEGGSVGDIFCVDNDIELMNVQIV